MPDYELILVEGHCAACERPVTTPLDELRSTGILVCGCGAWTRARPPAVEARPLFRGWTGSA